MRYLSSLTTEVRGKVCLLRVDFNVESAQDSLRLEASLPTLRFLLKNGARVVILSHRGRPQGIDPKLSLKFAVPFLEKNLKQKVVFIPRLSAFGLRRSANVYMIENLRFWPEEEKNDLGFAKKLARLGDLYVNDAFAVCHRENSSVTQLPKLLPSYAGLLLEKEVRNLSQVMQKPKKPLVVIFGGVKIADKTPAIKNLLSKTDWVLFGSAFINESTAKTLLPASTKIILPSDWISENGKALDIGSLTIEKYEKIIRTAKTVIWNGPVGWFENPKYRAGSVAIAKAIAQSKAFSVVGGGETTQLILELKLQKKISFLSTGGGAMLDFLAGKKLPGLEALK